jgi:DNA-3-methyladenine glycosylase II
VLSTSLEQFRSAGVSRQKAGYVLDLAAHVADGRLQLSRLSKLDDQEIIDELVAVKGVGAWTAQMFLMFTLGRPDVLAPADLGLQKGMQRLYGLPALPNPAEMQAIAARRRWSPYRTVACWYLWRVAEEPK